MSALRLATERKVKVHLFDWFSSRCLPIMRTLTQSEAIELIARLSWELTLRKEFAFLGICHRLEEFFYLPRFADSFKRFQLPIL